MVALWLAMALLQEGDVAQSCGLADSYVWVTKLNTAVGRVNTEIREQDRFDDGVGAGVEVRPDGAAVFVRDDADGWQRLHPAELVRSSLAVISTASLLEVGGGTLALVDHEGAVYTIAV